MKMISVLVPTFNEEDNVIPLSEAIIEQFQKELPGYDYEVIFIDNDSEDDTQNKIRELCASNPKIKAIFNARNFGQFSSPFYGIQQANGDCVIAMCADFQDPVELISKYVREWEAGYKIVVGQKTSSKENKIVRTLRNIYYWLMKKNSEVRFMEHVTGSGLYDREFIEILRKMDDRVPFIRGIIAEVGYKVKSISYEQPKRKTGKSSNNLFKYYDAAALSFTNYTKIGVRLAVAFGLFFTIISMMVGAAFGIYKILNWHTFSIQPFALDLILFFIVSIQILFIGVIGEYILNINSQMKKRPLVIESERINF